MILPIAGTCVRTSTTWWNIRTLSADRSSADSRAARRLLRSPLVLGGTTAVQLLTGPRGRSRVLHGPPGCDRPASSSACRPAARGPADHAAGARKRVVEGKGMDG